MNIMYLDRDPMLCARYHVNKHIIKMALEYAQQLCIAQYVDKFLGCRPDKLDTEELRIFKDKMKQTSLGHLPKLYPYIPAAYVNYPCSIWVRSDSNNYLYIKELLECINYEYQFRFKTNNHLEAYTSTRYLNPPDSLPVYSFTDPPISGTGKDCEVSDAVLSHRRYYFKYKKHLADWGNRSIPDWFNKESLFAESEYENIESYSRSIN